MPQAQQWHDPLIGRIVVASAPEVKDGMSTGMSTIGAKRQQRTSGKGNLQMIKKTPHFLINFLQISTIFASFS
jgi:hypothetical protein